MNIQADTPARWINFHHITQLINHYTRLITLYDEPEPEPEPAPEPEPEPDSLLNCS